jgi:hypothetical protein
MKPEWSKARNKFLETRNIIWAHKIREAELKASVFYGIGVACGFFLLTNFLTPLPDVLNGWLSLIGAGVIFTGATIVVNAKEVPPRIRSGVEYRR